jgi:hypothetical protein
MYSLSAKLALAAGVSTLSLAVASPQEAGSTVQPCKTVAGLSRLPDLPEASGIAVSRKTAGVIWSINDSGRPVIHALNEAGAVVGRVRIAGAEVQDWEDVSVAACPRGTCVYLADIGDNNARRNRITIYRVAEPDAKADTTEIAEALHATYPDQPQDAEALFVTPQGQMFVVTKGDTGPIALYRFPSEFRAGASVQLQRVSALPIGQSRGDDRSRVTDAETSPDGLWVGVRTHDEVVFYRTSDLVSGSPQERVRADIKSLREPRGEGVAIGPGGIVYLVGEGVTGAGTFARLACTLGNDADSHELFSVVSRFSSFF